MRGIVLQFLILFSVFCAGLHAPAVARDDHGRPSIILAEAHHADAHEDFSDDSSADPSKEVFPHHHCPAAMMVACGPTGVAFLAGRDMLRPGEVVALMSRASAPPIEPPLA